MTRKLHQTDLGENVSNIDLRSLASPMTAHVPKQITQSLEVLDQRATLNNDGSGGAIKKRDYQGSQNSSLTRDEEGSQKLMAKTLDKKVSQERASPRSPIFPSASMQDLPIAGNVLLQATAGSGIFASSRNIVLKP